MQQAKRLALTEAFHEAMSRQRLVAAVFLTYRFEPGSFEQEVLPAFFDRPFSTNDPKVKLAQLEAVLQERPGSVAVYYDANGLKGGEEPAKLDVGRFPVRLERGIFHPAGSRDVLRPGIRSRTLTRLVEEGRLERFSEASARVIGPLTPADDGKTIPECTLPF